MMKNECLNPKENQVCNDRRSRGGEAVKNKTGREGLPRGQNRDRFGLTAEAHRERLGHFVGARLIDGRVGRAGVRGNDVVGEHEGFDFFTADVGQHASVDFHAGAQHLAALFNHFLALRRVVDDVAVFKREVVFAQHGTNTIAPATGGLQVSDNLRFFHRSKSFYPNLGTNLPKNRRLATFSVNLLCFTGLQDWISGQRTERSKQHSREQAGLKYLKPFDWVTLLRLGSPLRGTGGRCPRALDLRQGALNLL